MNPENEPKRISISFEDANSPHVDDMLKRQMSMRGEPGVTRDRGRRWYYQNWLVFSIVGMLAAIAAWGVVEPRFYDYPYIQGEIQAVNPGGTLELHGGAAARLEMEGWILLNDQKIWISSETRNMDATKKHRYLDFADLREGEKIGVYAHRIATGRKEAALAYFVTRKLKNLTPERAALTIEQQASTTSAMGLLLFPLTAGFIGLAIGAVDGIICRLPRRALLSGVIGLVVGLIGGFAGSILANVFYGVLSSIAQHGMVNGSFTMAGFLVQMIGRGIAWAMAGVAMGLGQGIALRSGRLLIYGLLGGIIGGLLGGLLFDPIDFFVLGKNAPSAAVSRFIGTAAVGLCVGAMIGIVELLARDAWLRMTQGPLAGKEFLLFKDVMNVGASPRSDIYLFNDPLVAPDHAVLRAVGDECEVESRHRDNRVLLNNRPIQTARLRHNDQVLIGRTLFVYEKRKR